MNKNFLIILFIFSFVFSFLYFKPKNSFKYSPPQKHQTPYSTTSPTPSPPPTPSPTPTSPTNQSLLQIVPFTPQAPLGEWQDPVQQDGCEEASTLIAVSWAKGEPLGSPQIAKEKMFNISSWQEQNYDSAIDTSTQDTLDRIIKGYFKYQSASLSYPTEIEDLIESLTEETVIIAPMNGQALGNPHFTSPGPERHMLVIIGYDYKTQEFITNDPGTRWGQGYRYNQQVLWQAIRDYPTGDHEPIIGQNKVIIVVRKPSS